MKDKVWLKVFISFSSKIIVPTYSPVWNIFEYFSLENNEGSVWGFNEKPLTKAPDLSRYI